MSTEGGTRGDGNVHAKDENSMAVSGLGCTQSQPGGPFLKAYIHYQELMSGGAAKERATTAYARVPSKSKLLASELNMETCSSI